MALVVHDGEGEDQEANLEQDFESNPVTEEEFGEYVASLHSCNNSTFVLQYEVIQYNNCAVIQSYTLMSIIMLTFYNNKVIGIRRGGSRS